MLPTLLVLEEDELGIGFANLRISTSLILGSGEVMQLDLAVAGAQALDELEEVVGGGRGVKHVSIEVLEQLFLSSLHGFQYSHAQFLP